MTDKRQHRGAHPEDEKLFAPEQIKRIRQAVSEMSWLLSRNYSIKSSLKIVGDHHRLNERQRAALQMAACSDEQRDSRKNKCADINKVSGSDLIIDGFNLLINLEAALSGGLILICRDGCLRDLSSVHGTYRSVDETEDAINMIGRFLAVKKTGSVRWLLDRPISNSGRLAHKIMDIAMQNNWPWTAELVNCPDYVLRSSGETVVTSDSAVLDKAAKWVNLGMHLVKTYIPDAWLIDL
ncbi:MAG: DUF434 domain-containing protein [Victivallales bacterium]|jgi:hypothetical protein